jgi:hypothetical protein
MKIVAISLLLILATLPFINCVSGEEIKEEKDDVQILKLMVEIGDKWDSLLHKASSTKLEGYNTLSSMFIGTAGSEEMLATTQYLLDMHQMAKVLLELSNNNGLMERFNKIDNEKERISFVVDYMQSWELENDIAPD